MCWTACPSGWWGHLSGCDMTQRSNDAGGPPSMLCSTWPCRWWCPAFRLEGWEVLLFINNLHIYDNQFEQAELLRVVSRQTANHAWFLNVPDGTNFFDIKRKTLSWLTMIQLSHNWSLIWLFKKIKKLRFLNFFCCLMWYMTASCFAVFFDESCFLLFWLNYFLLIARILHLQQRRQFPRHLLQDLCLNPLAAGLPPLSSRSARSQCSIFWPTFCDIIIVTKRMQGKKMKTKIIVIVGPTAVGKTALAIEIGQKALWWRGGQWWQSASIQK